MTTPLHRFYRVCLVLPEPSFDEDANLNFDVLADESTWYTRLTIYTRHIRAQEFELIIALKIKGDIEDLLSKFTRGQTRANYVEVTRDQAVMLHLLRVEDYNNFNTILPWTYMQYGRFPTEEEYLKMPRHELRCTEIITIESSEEDLEATLPLHSSDYETSYSSEEDSYSDTSMEHSDEDN